MHLTGEFEHNLDAKFRLTLPASFRKQFSEGVIVLVPVPYENAIYGFTPEGHEAWVQSYFPDGYNPKSKKDVQRRRVLNKIATTVEIDSAGRVALGKLHKEDLDKRSIEREVVVFGNDDHFEIWNKDEYEAQAAEYEALEDLFFE